MGVAYIVADYASLARSQDPEIFGAFAFRIKTRLEIVDPIDTYDPVECYSTPRTFYQIQSEYIPEGLNKTVVKLIWKNFHKLNWLPGWDEEMWEGPKGIEFRLHSTYEPFYYTEKPVFDRIEPLTEITEKFKEYL